MKKKVNEKWERNNMHYIKLDDKVYILVDDIIEELKRVKERYE